MKFIFAALTFNLYSYALVAQEDFKCTNDYAQRTFDMNLHSRTYGDYEVDDAWSKSLSSGSIEKIELDLKTDYQYVFVLITEKDADATAIELRDEQGGQLLYQTKIADFDKNQLTVYYTAEYTGVYQLLFRVMNTHQPTSCSYMAVLEGDVDEIIQQEEVK